MNKYEVENFGIDGDGELWIQRKYYEGSEFSRCPFAVEYDSDHSLYRGKLCGQWCPLFGEVEESTVCQPLHPRDIVYGMNTSIIPPSIGGKAAIREYRIKSISLCHKTIWCRVKDAEANKEE